MKPVIARRGLLTLLIALGLAGCGAGRAVTQTGQLFDKYGCLAKELKGEPACPQQ